MGAKITFRFDDGSTYFVAGTCPDISHISEMKKKIQDRTKKKVVGHSAIFMDLFEVEQVLFRETRPILL
jgi:hypothetical protein